MPPELPPLLDLTPPVDDPALLAEWHMTWDVVRTDSLGRSMYYDRRGQAITMRQWATGMESPDYKRVAATEISDGIFVSTVWLGLDHSFGFDGPPVIFETMVFVKLDEPVTTMFGTYSTEGTEMYRYSTEEEALRGHEEVVAELKSQFDATTKENNGNTSPHHSP